MKYGCQKFIQHCVKKLDTARLILSVEGRKQEIKCLLFIKMTKRAKTIQKLVVFARITSYYHYFGITLSQADRNRRKADWLLIPAMPTGRILHSDCGDNS